MWEVVIGAVAALAGGFGGAWLQARSSKRLLDTQLADAVNARQEAYEREDRTRFAEQKRQAYSTLMSVWADLDQKRQEADQAAAAATDLPDPDPLDGEALTKAIEVHTEAARASQEVEQMLGAVISAMETVALLAPGEVRAALPRGSFAVADRPVFFKAARRDLGIPD